MSLLMVMSQIKFNGEIMDTIICPICGREMVVDTIAEKTERSTFGDYRCGVKDMLVDTERDI